jgi:hypothetical protein
MVLRWRIQIGFGKKERAKLAALVLFDGQWLGSPSAGGAACRDCAAARAAKAGKKTSGAGGL